MQNKPFKANVEMNNQGYRNIKMTFPQATFSSCRYATGLKANRPLQYSNWHSRQHEWDEPAGKVRLARTIPNPEYIPEPAPKSPQASQSIRQPGVPAAAELDQSMHNRTRLRNNECYRPSKMRYTRETPKVWDNRLRGWVEADALYTQTGY